MKINKISLLLLLISSLTLNGCFVLVYQAATAKDRAKTGKTDKKDTKNFSERLFTSKELYHLRNTTTLFLLRKEDIHQKEKFEDAINAVWDFNKIKVINYNERKNYSNENYSYFTIEGYNTTVQNYKNNLPTTSYDVPHIYLTLKYSFLEKNKKGKPNENSINYCRIELFPDAPTMDVVMTNSSDDVVNLLYQDSHIKNWTPGMIKLYLEDVQSKLKKSKREFLFETTKMERYIQWLKNDTLYIPHYALTKFNKFTGDESQKHSPSELFKHYKYAYKIVESEELSDKIVKGEVNYVFDYVKSSADKFVRVYSLTNGKIYQSYKALSYNLKSKDISNIVK